jgi:hypothetical protein
LIGALLAVPLAASISAVGNEVRLRSEHLGQPGPEPLGGPNGQLAEEREEADGQDERPGDEEQGADDPAS